MSAPRRNRPWILIGPLVATATFVAAQSPPQTPVFRAGVDLVQLDVSVLDKNRRPVHGLTASDFVVREDGALQTVDTFAEVVIPDAPAPPPVWTRGVSPDVATNQLDNHRLFAIVMDDATIENDVEAINNAKKIGHAVIDKLAPTDLAAVIFTRDNRDTQNFTNDPVKLHAAIDNFSMGFRGMSDVTNDPSADGLSYANSIHVLEEVVHYMIAAPDRRKALVYVGQGVPVDHSASEAILLGRASNPRIKWREMQLDLIEKMKSLFQEAQKANVSVYAMDACGLRAAGGDPQTLTCQPGLEVDFLQTVANSTGGKAVVNTRDFEPGLEQMFVENSSYYLLGYRRTKVKGTGEYARLDVSVKKSGVTVRTRHLTYNEPSEEERAAKDHRAPATPAEKSLSGILPDRDTPMRVSAIAFGLPAAPHDLLPPQAVAIVLDVQEPAPVIVDGHDTTRGQAAGLGDRVDETIQLLTMAFTPEGDQQKSQTQTVQVRLRPTPPEAQRPAAGPAIAAEYELQSRIDLEPGRYSLRIATHNFTSNQDGSVFVDVDVPDFPHASLSMSGVAVESSDAHSSASSRDLAALIPIVPTTERSFDRSAGVRTFLRIYQGDASAPAPVTLRTVIRDRENADVFTQSSTIDASTFKPTGSVDVPFTLPLSRLPPGPYVISFEATKTGTSSEPIVVRRSVMFSVKSPDSPLRLDPAGTR